MYIMNPYVVHENIQIEGCYKKKNGSTTVIDSNLTLANLCLLKEKNPKQFVLCEGREGDLKEMNAKCKDHSAGNTIGKQTLRRGGKLALKTLNL